MGQLINDTDLLAMFEALGNDSAVINGTKTVTGVFSNKYQAVDNSGFIVESMVPTFTCRSSDLSGVANGQTCVIGTETYKVQTLEPDGQGGTVIILRR